MRIERLTRESIGFRYSSNYSHSNNADTTILFIGGSFQSLESINRLQKMWPTHYSAITVELPGFGGSDFLPDQYGFDFLTDCITDVIDAEGVRSCTAFGYSYGSGPLFRLAARRSDIVESLIIGGASVSFTSEMVGKMQRLVDLAFLNHASFPSEFLNTLAAPAFGVDVVNGRISRLMLTRLLRSLTDAERGCFAANYTRLLREHEAVNSVTVPTLAFTGEHDCFTRFDRLKEFSRFCTDLTVVPIGSTDHFCHLQRPDAVSRVVESFLSSNRISQLYAPPIW